MSLHPPDIVARMRRRRPALNKSRTMSGRQHDERRMTLIATDFVIPCLALRDYLAAAGATAEKLDGGQFE
jgi:hypothetical protein